MVKPMDVAIYDFLADYARGEFSRAAASWASPTVRVDISYSGGDIDHLRPQLKALRAGIVAGEIQVPLSTDPSTRALTGPPARHIAITSAGACGGPPSRLFRNGLTMWRHQISRH